MINLVFTLLALAAGILLGSAGVFLFTKKLSDIQTVFAGLAMMLLLCIFSAFALWCEEMSGNPHSLVPWFDSISTAIILSFGIYLAIVFHSRKEIKKALKEWKKRDWIAVASATLLAKLPLIIWIVMSLLSDHTCWVALAVAIGISITTVIVFYVLLNFAWVLKYGFCNTIS